MAVKFYEYSSFGNNLKNAVFDCNVILLYLQISIQYQGNLKSRNIFLKFDHQKKNKLCLIFNIFLNIQKNFRRVEE